MVRTSQSRTSYLKCLLLLSLVCLVAMIAPGAAAASRGPLAAGDYGHWEPFIGTDMSSPALPDYNANYFVFAFDRIGDARYVGLRMKGQFGYARYMSYNIYRAHRGPSFGALTDYEMLAAPGSVNPFAPGVDPNAPHRSYVVAVQPSGYAVSPQENTLQYDPAQIGTLVVIIRYYVPQGSETAGVPLPTIEAYDVRTKQALPLPKQHLLGDVPLAVFGWMMRPIFTSIVDNTLRFYHVTGVGQFPNADNQYLIGAVTRKAGQVVVLRFKPPTFPKDASEYGATQVRYWSLNEENPNTSTPIGLRDDQFKLARDGYVYVAIGDKSVRRAAVRRGYNFMPWLIRRQSGAIIYRNLVTDPSYPGRIDNVPAVDLSDEQNIYAQDASNFIGDYAPRGVKVGLKQFLKNGGGIVPPR